MPCRLAEAAAAAGVDQATIQSATGNLEPNDAASFIGQQPEFTTPIWDYMAALVDEERVAEGRQKLGEYANALAAARERFGVDPATLVAIWGVESDYGKGFRLAPGRAVAGDALVHGEPPGRRVPRRVHRGNENFGEWRRPAGRI